MKETWIKTYKGTGALFRPTVEGEKIEVLILADDMRSLSKITKSLFDGQKLNKERTQKVFVVSQKVFKK